LQVHSFVSCLCKLAVQLDVQLENVTFLKYSVS